MDNRHIKRQFYRYGKLRLGVLLLSLPLAVWFCGWRKTTSLWQVYRQNEMKLQEMQLLPDTLKGAASVMLPGSSALCDGRLLDRIRQMNEGPGVIVLSYTPWLTREEGELQLYTAELTLAGSFIPMLRIAAALEYEGGYGGLAAARFRTQTNSRTREKQLQLTLWIQQMIEK